MELEFKHLAAYFPYGLKCMYIHKTIEKQSINNKVFRLDSIITNNGQFIYWTHDRTFLKQIPSFTGKGFRACDFKPILRPLSDLTKEIEVNREKFVPVKEYSYLRFEEISTFTSGSRELGFISVREQDVLLELNFDVFGLIESGFTVDINSINQQL